MGLRYYVVNQYTLVNCAIKTNLLNCKSHQINQSYKIPCCRFSDLTKTPLTPRRSNLTAKGYKRP